MCLEPLFNKECPGGLENLKVPPNHVKTGWDKDLPVKGVLLARCTGGGKSLTAKPLPGMPSFSARISHGYGPFLNKYLGETGASSIVRTDH